LPKQGALAGPHSATDTQPEGIDGAYPRPGVDQHGKDRRVADDADGGRVAETEPENEQRHPSERGNWHQRTGKRQKEVFDRTVAAHQDPKRQGNCDGERKAQEHPIERGKGVPRQGSVQHAVEQGAPDSPKRRQQRGGKSTAACQPLVDRRGEQQRGREPAQRSGALRARAHVIIPQRTTVKSSSRLNTSVSKARPMAPMTTTPASITSVFRNSRAPKIIQPRPQGTAASISTPIRMRQACARPSRNPVR